MFDAVLSRLGLREVNDGASSGSPLPCRGGELVSLNPATGEPLGRVHMAAADDYETLATRAQEAFEGWRAVPPPARGEVIRQFGQALRERKADLGLLVTLETGKIRSEGEGEVQEMIDMCD